MAWRGKPLLLHMAGLVKEAVGSAIVLGPYSRYGRLAEESGLACWDDLHSDLGPLSGLETALTRTCSDLNLVVAVDLPGIAPVVLRDLLHTAMRAGTETTVARDPNGQVHPLCAVYHRISLKAIQGAIRIGDLRMMNVLEQLEVSFLDLAEPLSNLNRPEDWSKAEAAAVLF